MTHTKKLALLSVTATLLLSGAALANPKADTNKDGQISKAEFVAHASERFAKADTNGDGVVTKEERRAESENRKAEMTDAYFNKIDANNDGVISKAEFNSMSAKRGENRKSRWDANGDGDVNVKDREARHAKRKEMHEKRQEKGEKRKAMRKDKGEWFNPDANGDGVITLDEHKAATEAMFARMDVNKDGILSEGEGRMRRKGHKGHEKRGPKD